MGGTIRGLTSGVLMLESHWQKIDEIFSGASDLSGLARANYLRSACLEDEAILAEVVALLREHDHPSPSFSDSFFNIGLRVLDQGEVDGRNGTKIGRFTIGKLIGRGGMGAVYAGHDSESGRAVAIKLVDGLFALDPERIRRFRKEANAASRVLHPNVAKLYELCEDGGEHIIVMEFVEGESLREHLNRPVSPEMAVDIAIQVASALVAAHSVGVVHRDIKPENIIIKYDGTVKVLDFGLAKLVEPIGTGAIHFPGGEETKLTADMSTELGALMGTPAYMSPEQIRGVDVDTQTDIWSLGVLLYEMLTGELPFRGPTKIDLIAAVLVSDPALLKIGTVHFADGINTILSKSLAKNKPERYPDAGSLLTDLRSLQKDRKFAVSTFQWFKGIYGAALKYSVSIVLIAGTLTLVLPASREKITAFFYTSPRPAVSVTQPVTDGMVSYWPADGNANDIVGGNNGELSNGATFRPGVSGKAFSFDGIDAVFQAPTKGFPTGNSDRTVAMWVAIDSFTASNFVNAPEEFFGGYGKFGGYEQAYSLGATGGFLFITNWGKGIGGPALLPGNWYHIAAATLGNSTSLFLNGSFVTSSDVTLNTPADATFCSGRIPGEHGDVRKLDGAVDEIRIYDRALSPEEIHALFSVHTPPIQ